MIYVVTGFVRTGTSMMMNALIAGGMDAVWSEAAERLNDNGDEHYKPNPSGFREIEVSEYEREDLPERYRGKLIKVVTYQRQNGAYVGIPQLTVNPEHYRIVWMLRDSEEIRQSWEASEIGRSFPPEIVDNIQSHQAHCFRLAMNRRDIDSVLPFNFRDVIKDKLDDEPRVFRAIADMGWPIDPAKALEAVDVYLYRYRAADLGELKANLTPGI